MEMLKGILVTRLLKKSRKYFVSVECKPNSFKHIWKARCLCDTLCLLRCHRMEFVCLGLVLLLVYIIICSECCSQQVHCLMEVYRILGIKLLSSATWYVLQFP